MSYPYEHIRARVREVSDFPIPGINFCDIAPVLEDPTLFREVIAAMCGPYRQSHIDKVLCIESRGFVFGPAMAYELGAGVVMVRKRGKLPYRTISREHALEYGTSILEMHVDSIKPGERVIVVDDLLATGGTAEAAVYLAEQCGGFIDGLSFFIELPLGGREKLYRYNIFSLLMYGA